MKAGGGPLDLMVVGSSTRSIRDVLIGEVWFCSGQSNMEFRLRMALSPDKEIAAAKYPNLRLFTVHRAAAAQPLADVNGHWDACEPQVMPDFSAVAYFFGRDLHQALNVPVGIIHSSWGGCYIESWISPKTLASDVDSDAFRGRWERRSLHFPQAMEAYQKALADWEAANAEAKAAGKKPATAEPLSAGGQGIHRSVARPPRSTDQTVEHYPIANPSGLYNGMVAPAMPFAIRGVIWYQGESNFQRGAQYARLLPEMIADWRANWGEGSFPFLYVQLPYFGGIGKPEDPPRDDWFSEAARAQCSAQSAPNTAMVVMTDNTIDNDIHPRNKQLFGAAGQRGAGRCL